MVLLKDLKARIETRISGRQFGIEGRFILSINDVPEIRGIFVAFNIKDVQTSYGIASKAGIAKGRKELIITNWE